MKLNDEQLEIIQKADAITNYWASTTEETYWLNEEEAYHLIEYLVEECEALKNEIKDLKCELDVKQEQIDDLLIGE